MTLISEPKKIRRFDAMSRRIRAARALCGMDQAQLGAQLGVTHQTVSNWELGKSEPSATQLIRLIQLSGTSVEFFAASLNDEAAQASARAAIVRPEGFEPPTFCFGVSLPEAMAVFALILAKNAGLLVSRN